MYVYLALLAFGAICVTFFIALLCGGALVGLGSLGLRALHTVDRR